VPIEDLFPKETSDALHHSFHKLVRGYRRSLQSDRRHLLEEFQFVQIARKVVGVGSVGTRAWILLLVGLNNQDPLFLQAKEAEASVLEQFVGKSGYANHGARVVAGQHLMQAASDRNRRIDPARAGQVREGLRPGAGPRPRPLGRSRRYRQLSRKWTVVRPCARGIRRGLCRSERT
jgi:hypothetical protein